MRLTAAVTLFAACLQPYALAADCTARQASSGPRQTAFVELYTSEGCNSCPPAEHWLSGLRAAGFGPQQVVALAFHVDYWDYLGWKDRFAQPAYTARQHARADQLRASFVYTPQLLLNGQDWRGGNNGTLRSQLNAAPASPAHLSLKSQPTPRGVSVSLDATAANAQVGDAVYVALYENNLHSQIGAGENNGALLIHDGVVRTLLGPYPLDASGHLGRQLSLDYASGQLPQNSGIAAWVENSRSGRVAQAVSLSCAADDAPNGG